MIYSERDEQKFIQKYNKDKSFNSYVNFLTELNSNGYSVRNISKEIKKRECTKWGAEGTVQKYLELRKVLETETHVPESKMTLNKIYANFDINCYKFNKDLSITSKEKDRIIKYETAVRALKGELNEQEFNENWQRYCQVCNKLENEQPFKVFSNDSTKRKLSREILGVSIRIPENEDDNDQIKCSYIYSKNEFFEYIYEHNTKLITNNIAPIFTFFSEDNKVKLKLICDELNNIQRWQFIYNDVKDIENLITYIHKPANNCMRNGLAYSEDYFKVCEYDKEDNTKPAQRIIRVRGTIQIPLNLEYNAKAPYIKSSYRTMEQEYKKKRSRIYSKKKRMKWFENLLENIGDEDAQKRFLDSLPD